MEWARPRLELGHSMTSLFLPPTLVVTSHRNLDEMKTECVSGEQSVLLGISMSLEN